MKISKIGILFTSRNNYQMLDSWMSKVDVENCKVLNIDEDSTNENKSIGKEICSKNNISYLDREDRGMQNNITTACKYFQSSGVEWIVWFAHDCFPLGDNFFSNFNKRVNDKKLNNFGVVGFNNYHSQISHRNYENGLRELYDTARAPLEVGDMWYRSKQQWVNSRVDYNNSGFKKPFAVESVVWNSAAVNIEMYMNNIIPTDDYHFFHAWDDIAFQFLYKNIYNICLPDFNVKHNQQSKRDFGIPTNSPKAGNKREHYFSKWGHLEVWKDRWGFDYSNRDTFEPVKEHYKGTLLWDFYHHDPVDGPLQSFDV